MLNEAKILHDMTANFLEEVSPLIKGLEKKTEEDMSTMGAQQVDTAYACREAIRLVEEAKKQINRVYTKAQAVACLSIKVFGQEKYRTQYATASPDPVIFFKFPSRREKDPDKYDEIMEYLQVSRKAYESESVIIHNLHFVEEVTRDIGRGVKVPFDPKDMTSTLHRLKITKRKDI